MPANHHSVTVALRQQRKVNTPRRSGKSGRRNISRRRMGRKRVFVQRHQVIAVISALGTVEGEHPGLLATMRLGRNALLEFVVDRVARCAGGIVVLAPVEGVDAARMLVGERAEVRPATQFDLAAIVEATASSEAPVTLLHDLAFPFAGSPLMTRLALAALDHGGAVPTEPGALMIAEVNDGLLLPLPGPEQVQRTCMPQAFLSDSLRSLHADEGGALAAERVWQQLQKRGEMIQSVANPRFNIKIAHSMDWLTARKVVWPWLAARNNRGGSGGRRGAAPAEGA